MEYNDIAHIRALADEYTVNRALQADSDPHSAEHTTYRTRCEELGATLADMVPTLAAAREEDNATIARLAEADAEKQAIMKDWFKAMPASDFNNMPDELRKRITRVVI